MNATEARLLEFLKKSPQFVIPIYQRTYSWGVRECGQLWDDILRTGRNDAVSAHFIGSVVYVEKGLYSVSSQSPLLVIDGQQRLTSVTLLVEALARSLGESEPLEGFSARKLRNYYLLNPEEAGEKHYKLILSQTDKASLVALLDGQPRPKEHSIRVEANFEFFKERVGEVAGELPALCKGLAKLMIVDISLNRDQDNPQLIFESLNSTGRELSQADLIRNFILMGLEPQLQTKLYEQYWRPMEVDFGQEGYATHFDGFMRHYLTVKTGDIPNVREVYEAFKQHSRSPVVAGAGVEALVADIRAFARHYCAMALGTEPDAALKMAFHDLRELKVDVAFPFLLELYGDYATERLTKDELVRATRWVESYVFRRAVCGIPTNSMNKTFATFTRALKKDRYLESVAAHFLLLPSYRRFPLDDEFQRELQVKDLYNFRSRSYWLRRLENHDRKERVPVDEYTIEHILPQNEHLSAEWRADLGPEWERIQKTWLHTLGNLTLTGYNPELSDRPFTEKRGMKGGFKDSPLRMNQGLGILDRWTEDAIKARAATLAGRAGGVWDAPSLPADILDAYKPKAESAASYAIEDHQHLASGPLRAVYEVFRKQVLALDPCVTEEFLKLYVAYKAETNFVDVIPQKKRLILMLNMAFPEITDPKNICRDVTGMGRWGNGDVEIGLASLDELPYVMGLVRQSLEKQLGNGTDARMITDINSEDRLVQQTVANHLRDQLGWETVYAHRSETFGPQGTLGRMSEREAVLLRDLRAAVVRLNPDLPKSAREQAVEKLSRIDFARSVLQHNREYYGFIRGGVPVEWRDTSGETRHAHAQVIDFSDAARNRFLAVRELRVQGVRVPHYNRRADLVCFVNGLPLVFIELKAVYRNIRAGFDDNLTDYLSEHSIAHAFHHNVFLVVSNGDHARYGSITSRWEHFVEWKRNEEADRARLDAVALLDGMLAKDRLLDIVENFILFDDSRTGGTRKIVARNHQVMGVNRAVESVFYQEGLKKQFPPGERLYEYRVSRPGAFTAAERSPEDSEHGRLSAAQTPEDDMPLVRRAHPDLGRLGVFWHTQGSGKSYSMAFFAEKVRRKVPGNFTFLVMTDREDLDSQIARTFAGCGIVDQKTPRASSGRELQALLLGNHRFIFSLIHKFNQSVEEPYSERDDIIVISDEAHRTQSGRFARNMRLALPNASFIGFTGTPLFKHDELTRRIFGDYVSRYDFRRSEEDRSTVRLVYENRGEKLGLARVDLNDRIADAIERADLDEDQTAVLERLLGKDYEVITADDRLDKLAEDFVEHCSARWQTGKSLFVCIDKITCARMLQRIEPRWRARIGRLRVELARKEVLAAETSDSDVRAVLGRDTDLLRAQIRWMDETIIEIVISEAQNEVRDFAKWGFDIIPHRVVMKAGFEVGDRRLSVEDAFKNPNHPFRIAIVCAMWLTGFDVECLATLYIDKPMKAHNLMQAIARANRVYPGKDCGVIVDYNGMLKSLREALAQYALGDDGEGEGDGGVVQPIETLVEALLQAIEAAEEQLRDLGFDVATLRGAKGFTRIEALRNAVDVLYTSDDDKRRFEITARQVFARFKALIIEPAARAYIERHDNIEAIYRKLEEKRDTADVTELLKELHRIVNEAIRAAAPGIDHAEGLTVDLSRIDFEKLRDEFAGKVRRKRAALQDIRTLVEEKLAEMLARNPMRMDYYRRYQEIIADYNREKDRVTVEDTFKRLVELAAGLDAEQRRTVEEGLTEAELALFDLMCSAELELHKAVIGKADRERLKQASRGLLASIQALLAPMPVWFQNSTTQAEVKVLILDRLWESLPRPPFTEDETSALADRVYEHVWQQSAGVQQALTIGDSPT